MAHILEFQLHRSLCIAANQYDPNNIVDKPLHKCDIDKSIVVGDKIRDGLSLGASKHWSEALKAMTGETEITGEAIVEYFAPLLEFLEKENEKFAGKFFYINLKILINSINLILINFPTVQHLLTMMPSITQYQLLLVL